MTTIVYYDGIIAADGRTTQADIILRDDTNKILVRNGVYFVLCGSQSDEQELINAYFGEKYRDDIDCNALVDDNGSIYSIGTDDKSKFWKVDITGKSHCIGHGKWHAWTALDCGCSAVEAVRMAIKRDIYTGGKIRTHKCKLLSGLK